MIRDRIVFDMPNPRLRETMLQDNQLTLQKAEEICRVAEMIAQRNEVWRKSEDSVDAISRRPSTTKEEKQAKEQHFCCQYNRWHKPKQCPPFGRKCQLCHKPNHFASCCSSAVVSEVGKRQNEDFDILEIATARRERDWMIKAEVSNCEIKFKVDTGSQASLFLMSIYRKLHGEAS